MNKKIALINGITGQDGSYLASQLIEMNYKVFGITRNKKINFNNLDKLNLRNKVKCIKIDSLEYLQIFKLLKKINPNEIYNLSGVTSVGYSISNPNETFNSIVIPTYNFLQSIVSLNIKTRYYNSCSSECFGDIKKGYADENTDFNPKSPYGLAKATSFDITKHYRKHHNIFASSGIAFNHESPLRGNQFICKKIIKGAIDINQNKSNILELGNLDIIRDWGWAPDFVKAYIKIINNKKPEDFIICAKNSYSLRYIVKYIFNYFNLNYKKYVKISKNNIRESDIIRSAGNNDKIKKELNWKHSHNINEILDLMIFKELNS